MIVEMVSVKLFVLVCAISVCIRSINAYGIRDFGIPVPEKIARCRLTCLEKFLTDDEPTLNVSMGDPCTDTPNCYMCWDFCKILFYEKKFIGNLMCNNHICYMGCQYACYYHDYLPWLRMKPSVIPPSAFYNGKIGEKYAAGNTNKKAKYFI